MAARDESENGALAAGQGQFVVTHPCPECEGQGTVDEQPCPACHGTGVERFFHGTKAALKPGDSLERLRREGAEPID